MYVRCTVVVVGSLLFVGFGNKKRLQHHFEHVHTAGDHDDGDHGADEHRWL
jgi:hypothetical protein